MIAKNVTAEFYAKIQGDVTVKRKSKMAAMAPYYH